MRICNAARPSAATEIITTKDTKGRKIRLIGEWLIGLFSYGSKRRNVLKKEELCKLL
jgi:hypothetical protein